MSDVSPIPVALLRAVADAAADGAGGSHPLGTAAAVVAAVGAARGWPVPSGLLVHAAQPDQTLLAVAIPPGLAGPALLGTLYEAALAPSARSAGAHYTPPDLAARLVGLVVSSDHRAGRPPRVWDPACGGGAFLLAAADALFAAGGDPYLIVAEQLWGTDIDPGAVAVAEAALCWWANEHAAEARPGGHLQAADPLLDGPQSRTEPASTRTYPDGPLEVAAAGGFDLVVGNPPFQGQLAGASIRPIPVAAALRARWGAEVVRPYTDTAALFLVAGARALAPGGRLLMILPTSVLAARDANAARAAVIKVAQLTGLWVAGELVFGASVQVCAVLLERPAPLSAGEVAGEAAGGPAGVRRWQGRRVEPLPTATAGSVVSAARSGSPDHVVWAGYALAALGVPDPPARFAGRLGSIATARAGFRDEYYGLVGHVKEAPDPNLGPDHQPPGFGPLVTTGLIDPGRCCWGERRASFARERFDRPVVDLTSLALAGGRAALWVTAMAVPKVVVATQTRVGEAAVDQSGTWVASTPTVAVVADPSRLWEVAAVVCSPVGTLAALAATAGSARAGDAIRHSVGSISGLPLPVDVEAWGAGAEALRRMDQAAFLAAMAAAYGLSPTAEVDDWWAARAPWGGPIA